MKPQFFRKEIRLLVIQFMIGFVAFSLALSGLYLYGYSANQIRLARAYARSSRESLILRDFRQTVHSLQPGLEDGFRSIGVEEKSGKLLVGLPTNVEFLESENPLLTKIRVPLLNESSRPDSEPVAVLWFVYSLQDAVLHVATIVLVTFLISIAFFVRARRNLEAHALQMMKNQEAVLIHQLARQVSHDIRGPLSVLKMLLPGMRDLDIERSAMVKHSLGRINDIASELIRTNAPRASAGLDLKAVEIGKLITQIVDEKRVLYSSSSNLDLEVANRLDGPTWLALNEKDFARALSNLLDNAVEAIDKASGSVQVELKKSGELVEVTVVDSGCGMSQEVLSRIGERGFSRGKEGLQSGSGLGVYQARQTVERLGGRFLISSTVGSGTRVELLLPTLTQAPIGLQGLETARG